MFEYVFINVLEVESRWKRKSIKLFESYKIDFFFKLK